MMSKLRALPIVLAVCVPGLFAQIALDGRGSRHGSIGISGPPASRAGFGEGMHRRRYARDGFFYGTPFYSDYYQPYAEEPRAVEPPPQTVTAPPLKNDPLPDSVMLELRGDQWVRVAGAGSELPQTPAARSMSELSSPPAATVAKETPPAILIYRDRHTEDVSSYSIIGGTIYTKANYWTEGAWTRKIQIADLDIPATLQQNRQRGVKFDLPSGPDEIVIRP